MKARFEKGQVMGWVDRMGLCVRYGVITDVSGDGLLVAQACADDGTAVCFNEHGRIRERDEHNVRLSGGVDALLRYSPVGSVFVLANPEKRVRFPFPKAPQEAT